MRYQKEQKFQQVVEAKEECEMGVEEEICQVADQGSKAEQGTQQGGLKEGREETVPSQKGVGLQGGE